MLSRSKLCFSYVRGGFSIYSAHQKHQAYAPVPYLYRFPGKRGPGPILMKYWHTLGTFPTGLEVPFRLDEFKNNYIRQHVPEELEDWLRCVVYDPVDTLSSNMEVFMSRLQNAPAPRRANSVLGRAQLLDAKNIHAPLQKAFDEFGIEIPVIAVRAVASTPRIKEDMLDVCFAYRETVAQIGSTPHRKWAAASVLPSTTTRSENDVVEKDSRENLLLLDDQQQQQQQCRLDHQQLSPEQARAVAKTLSSVLSFPNNNALVAQATADQGDPDAASDSTPSFEAAPDEILITKMLTTLAEGCHRGAQGKSAEAATRLLEAAMNFAQEDHRVAGSTHANLANAYAAQGSFEKAQLHAREAVLRDRSNPRAFAAWSVATALQDDLDTALQISADALQEYPTSDVLQQVYDEIARAATGRSATPEAARGKRYQLQSQCNLAMRLSGGKLFDNGMDWARDAHSRKRSALRLDPTYAGLGTDTKRSSEGSGPISHLNIEER